MTFDQIIILLGGVSSLYLSQDHRFSWRRWAPIIGMATQPFWFYATWVAEQWGIFFAAFLYTYAWGKGIHTYWIRKPDYTVGRLVSAECVSKLDRSDCH